MAITQAPFLSLGAKGAVAKTLVASTWKGIKTMRHYVTPANPKSTGQVAQRSVLAKIVAFWKLTATTEAITTAWNKLALVSGKPQSGFNAFTSNEVKLGNAGSYPINLTEPVRSEAGVVTFQIAEDETVGTARVDIFKLFVGSTENKLYQRAAVAVPTATEVELTYTPETGDTFFKVVGAQTVDDQDYEISGIYAIPAVTP